MEKHFFGVDKNGNEIFKYVLTDNLGNKLSVLNYGATIQSLTVKNSKGEYVDVVLGFDNLQQYENDENRTYFGAVCGRVAGRIENAQFYIEGEKYTLIKNNGNHCLHGGVDGFDKKFFDLTDADDDYMTFSLFSADGEEGFPGNISLSVRYTFRNGLLMIEYLAQTTASCPVNITNHSYFNLNGDGNILNHRLMLNSHFYMQCNDDCMSNGIVSPSTGTAFDFLQEKTLNSQIALATQQQPAINGIDHFFFCDNAVSEYRKFGTLTASDNSLKMDIFTNQCGAQIYTGNSIPNIVGKGNRLGKYSGIAIETQYAPGNLTYSHLPGMILHRGQQYYHKTGFRFYY